jgi:hypothetical protein
MENGQINDLKTEHCYEIYKVGCHAKKRRIKPVGT